MARYSQWIAYKGKRILSVNAGGLPEAEVIMAFEEMKQAVLKEGTGVLVLVDMSNNTMTQGITNKAKEAAAAIKAAGIKDKPNAVVGLTGLQKAVAQLFGRSLHCADSVEEAREWLVKEDDRRR